MTFIQKLNKKHIITTATILVIVILALPFAVHAGLDGVLIRISSWIAQQIIFVVGQLLLIAISILIKVAGFNEFVDADIVKTGWVIVRDVANLAIVISLLLIAFWTVLNRQSYHYKSMLPKLILAAILVNFSKSITGLLIDFGQIIMMYFVHAFEGIAAGNLTYGFGIEDMMSVRNVAEAQGAEVNDWNVFGALILAVIMVVVALGVVVSMAVMLLARIITLWILIIFSPLAFVGSLVPGLDAVTGDWWDRLKKNIVFGPTLAFLFWLSMTVISGITGASRMMNLQMSRQEYLAGGTGRASAVDYTYFASQVSSPQRVFDYMVTVGLLIMTLTVAQKAGVAGAGVASKWEAKMKGAGAWIAKRPQRIGKKVGKAAWERTKTSHVGEGVRALVQRGKTSWAGKKIGLDKEYSEMMAARRRARAEQYVGGKKGAIERDEWIRAMQARKKMEESGAFKNEKTRYDATTSAIKSGKLEEAIAGIQEMSKNKELSPEVANEFMKKFRGQLGSQKEQRTLGYLNTAWDQQDVAGDKTVAFKRTTNVDKLGNYVEQQSSDRVKATKKDYANRETRDIADAATMKALATVDLDNQAGHEVINQMAQRDDLGYINNQGKKQAVDYIDKVLAAKESGDLKPEDLNWDEAKIKELRNKLIGLESGKFSYDRNNGRIFQEDLQTLQNDMTSGGNYVYGEDGRADTLIGSDFENKHLKKVYGDIEEGRIKKHKEERILGKHEDTKVGEAIKKEIISTMDLSENIEEINKLRQEIVQTNDLGLKRSTIALLTNEMSNLRNKITDKLNDSKIKAIDPETGKKYAGSNLVEAFKKTDLFKTMNNISSEELNSSKIGDMVANKKEKNVLNSVDSSIIDVQDSYKNLWQTVLKDKAKPKDNQITRQETLSQTKRLKTGLDSMGKTQTNPKLYMFGRKTTKEMRRVRKTIDDLFKNIAYVDNKEHDKDLNKLNEKYEEYKNSRDKITRSNAQKEMETIAERILGRLET